MLRTLLTSLRSLPLWCLVGCAPIGLTVGDKNAPAGEGGESGTEVPIERDMKPVGAAGTQAGGAAAAGGAGAAAGLNGAAGQAPDADCSDLSCLEGAQLFYRPTREWQRPQGSVGTTTELLESDYTPLAGASVALRFSDDAQRLQLVPNSGDIVQGTRDPKHLDRARFDLNLFAGGRFEVKAGEGELSAEYTIYGSGVPVVSSTRGVVETEPTCAAGVARAPALDTVNACWLPEAVIGCYELIDPDLSVPTYWPSSTCARRKQDGVLFLVPSPQHEETWADCSPEELASTANLGFCQ